MYILIAGGGKIGTQLARKLIKDKHSVALIEAKPEKCHYLAAEIDGLVICGDSCDARFLEDAGIERADVVAAVTGDDEDNLIICQLAKERYHVKRTIARVNDSRNTPTFQALGVDVPVDSSAIITRLIDEEVSYSDMVTLLTLKHGRLAIIRVEVSEASTVIGKQVMNINLPSETVLISLVRKDEVVVPKGNTTINKGDEIIAMTSTANRQQVQALLSGKK